MPHGDEPMPRRVIHPANHPSTPMTARQFAATALTLATLPLTLGALLLRGRYVQQVALDFDPFEIDLQLHDRNDEE